MENTNTNTRETWRILSGGIWLADVEATDADDAVEAWTRDCGFCSTKVASGCLGYDVRSSVVVYRLREERETPSGWVAFWDDHVGGTSLVVAVARDEEEVAEVVQEQVSWRDDAGGYSSMRWRDVRVVPCWRDDTFDAIEEAFHAVRGAEAKTLMGLGLDEDSDLFDGAFRD